MRSLVAIAFVGIAYTAEAQWFTNGNHINNTNTGYVGIGTTAPNYKLHVVSSGAYTGTYPINSPIVSSTTQGNAVYGGIIISNDPVYGALFVGARARDNAGSPDAVLANDVLMGIYGRGHTGGGWTENMGAIRVMATENFTTTAQGTQIDFATTPLGATGRGVRMTINPTGNVGIGTTTPDQKLTVNGNIHIGVDNSLFYIDDGTNARLGFVKKAGSRPVIASDSGNPIVFAQSDQAGLYNNISTSTLTERMRIDVNGNVGIGTTSPQAKLHLKNGTVMASDVTYNNINVKMDASSSEPAIRFTRWTGTASTQHNAFIGQFTNSSAGNQHSLGIGVGQSTTGDQGSTTNAITILLNSNVGIGTNAPNEKLTVNGTIYGREVKVDLSVPGPDYVFEPTYNLPTLAETEAYIKTNKHLPEVPSAKEMEANGINLGEMNMLLLKKVEELTLHVIEMKKENIEQQQKIDALTSKMETLTRKQ